MYDGLLIKNVFLFDHLLQSSSLLLCFSMDSEGFIKYPYKDPNYKNKVGHSYLMDFNSQIHSVLSVEKHTT